MNIKIKEALTKNVAEVFPSKERLAYLMGKKKIRVYLGVDPTGGKLHLGHTIVFRKLQEFVSLGHKVFLIFGTGTVLAGDPSLRDSGRPKISEKEIKENIKTWREQVKKIIDLSKVEIKYNGDWLLKLKLKDIINISSNLSAVRLFQREMFQRRIKKGDTVLFSETMYPLMQGYDSVVLDADLEIGGSDQVFNMLIGRELQRKMKNREKYVLTMNMALGTNGEKMSKSSGNCIWILDSPEQKFGKIMSIPDNLVISYFELFTNYSFLDVQKFKKEMSPVLLKRKLAFSIVEIYHSKKEAEESEKNFNRIFKERKQPSKIPETFIKEKNMNILDLLLKVKLVSSKTEAKRILIQKGVKINGKIKNDWTENIQIKKGQVLQIGKRRFIKIAN